MIKKFKDYLDSFKAGQNNGGGFEPTTVTKPTTPENPGKPASPVAKKNDKPEKMPKAAAPVMPVVAAPIEVPDANNTNVKVKESPIDNAEPAKKDSHEGKEISGFKEVVEIEGLGKMKAKFDTGNTAYCAIIVQDFKENDGKVTFNFGDEEKTFPIEKHIKIWHHGKATERPVIKVTMKFNGKEYKDEMVDLKISDLTGTKNYRSRMLICKDFMKRANIMIDPSQDFKLTDKKELPKKKKTVKKDKKDEKSEK